MTTLTERADTMQKVWTIVLPTVAPPPALRFVEWCEVFSDEVLEYAFMRASKKVKKGGLVTVTASGAWTAKSQNNGEVSQ